jgi:hypothetical protein
MLAAGCTPTIRSEIYPNQNYDVSGYSTYAWANDNPLTMVGVLTGSPTEQLETRLKGEFSSSLANKGYTRVKRTENPEFVVLFTAGAIDQMSRSVHKVDRTKRGYDATLIWSQTNDYLEGAVSVSFLEPESKKTIWRGSAVDRVKDRDSRKQDGSTVKRLVEEIMKHVPSSRR